jgi:pyruvate/2-oxoglutarate dehydrogenase complex dihydrolipoamide acyltransferase (E2) component
LLSGEGGLVRVAIEMPNLGYDMESGIVAEWLKSIGDTITRGETIAEIETDKATLQMPALTAGTLVEIVHEAGSEVAVGEPIAYVETGD